MNVDRVVGCAFAWAHEHGADVHVFGAILGRPAGAIDVERGRQHVGLRGGRRDGGGGEDPFRRPAGAGVNEVAKALAAAFKKLRPGAGGAQGVVA